MRKPTHAGATVQQIEKEMMLWLGVSGDRGGRREVLLLHQVEDVGQSRSSPDLRAKFALINTRSIRNKALLVRDYID